jgi:starch synthase
VVAISPRYKPVADEKELPIRVRFWLHGQEHAAGFHAVDRDGVRYVLVDNPCFHRKGIYGDDRGAYPDNLFRYALLTRAALEVAPLIPVNGAPLGERVVFHANDWHTGLLPVYLDAHYRPVGRYAHAATVLGLHNLGHQGSTGRDAFDDLDLAPRWWPVLDMGGRLNPLKAGIVAADALVAVSPTYAKQIQLDHGFGLESALRLRRERIVGILNGIDEAWDPSTDRFLPARFDADDLSGKAVCKASLQKELGLPVRDVPLLGLVSRLDHQKGIDLVEQITPWLMARGVQLVMLGSGSPRHEAFLESLARKYPHQARGRVGFDEAMAHRIEAGCDLFLMPSRFEPCGLNQMYSMRYGTPPIVHATGGLADTVIHVDPRRTDGTGWSFREHTPEAFAQCVSWALSTWSEYRAAWRRIQRNGMTTDFSWDRSASLYERVYERTLQLRAGR